MNHAYRLIWNDQLNAFVAVAEIARTRGKRSGGTKRIAPMLAAFGLAFSTQALALPTGEQVVAGSVGFDRGTPSTLTVNQATNQAIVNWQSFNIGASETTRFVQPSAASVILNRIVGNEATQIFGSLQANGQVFMTNPSGVIFARGAQVDVGGLVATTLGISDQNFLNRNYTFTNGGNAGSVTNAGTINALEGGHVALIAPQVTNTGTITATGGQIGLAAGDGVVLDFDHDGIMNFKVDVAAAGARADNSGVIAADGGRVVMNASAKDALLSTVLSNTGVIRARGLAMKNGEIILDGGNSGVTSVTGTLDASNKAPSPLAGEGRGEGGVGGTVKVLGQNVGLFDQAKIDVSGETGGGTVLVGGNWQGKGPEHNAAKTYVGKDVTINADAITHGNGGKVVVWADDTTRFYGSISARGGAEGGDGGNVEVSGKHYLDFDGRFDARALGGLSGFLLLDPTGITIQEGAGESNISTESPFTSTGANSSIKWSTLAAALTGGTVTVQTSSNKDIALADGYNFATAGTASGTLKLDSAEDITAATGLTVTGRAGLSLWLKATGTTTINTALANFSNVTFENGAASTYSGAMSGSGTMTKTGSGALTLSGTNTYAGTTTVSAGTLELSGGSAISNSGAINLDTSGAALTITSSETIGSLAGVSGTTATIATGQTLTTGSAGSTTYSGTFGAANGGLTMGGSDNTFTLSGNSSSYAGAINVTSGTLAVTVDGALGSNAQGTTVASGGTLDFQNVAYATTEGVSLSGTIKTSTGTSSFAGGIGLAAASTAIDVGSSNSRLTLSGAISGGNALTKTGSGALVLSGTNTYSGITTVSAGTLQLAKEVSLYNNTMGSWTNTNIIVESGATLAFNVGGAGEFTNSDIATLLGLGTSSGGFKSGSILGLDTTNAGGGVFTYNTVIANPNGGSNVLNLTKLGTGTLYLNQTANTYTGQTAINGGTLKVDKLADGTATSSLGQSATAILVGDGSNAGTLEFAGSGDDSTNRAMTFGAAGGTVKASGSGSPTLTGTVTIGAGTNTFDVVSGKTVTVSGKVTGTGGSLAKSTGTGTLKLMNSTNDYTGVTAINAGTLVVTANNALGAVGGGNGTTVASGATLGIDGTSADITYSATEAVTLSGGTLNNVSGDNSFAGAVTLGAASAINSATSGKTLTLGGGIDNGGYLLTLSGAGNVTETGVISGAGGLTKTGVGTAYLNQTANTYTGQTAINGGTLKVGAAAPSGSVGALGNAFSAVLLGDTSGSADAALLINGAYTVARNITVQSGSSGTATLGGSNTSGTSVFSGGVTMNKALTVTAASGGTTELSGVLDDASGTFGVTKTGAGTVKLSGTNTYDGSTTINAGTLQITADRSLGNTPGSTDADNIILAGGTLEATTTFALHANRGITVSGTGTIDAASSTTFTTNGISLADGVTLNLGDGSGGSIVTGAISGTSGGTASNITINTGGTASMGTLGTDIGTLTVTNSGGTTFGGTVGSSSDRIASVVLTNTTGTIAFNDTLHATALSTGANGQSIAFNGGTTDVTNAVNLTNTGSVAFGNGGDSLTFNGGLTATAPSGVTLNGTLRTSGDVVSIGDANTPITLAGTTSVIDTTSGTATGANITLGGAINATTASTQGLTLNAGTSGTVTLGGTIGSTSMPLSALGVTVGGAQAGTALALPSISTGNLTITATSGAITQQSGSSLSATGDVVITTTAADVTLYNTGNNLGTEQHTIGVTTTQATTGVPNSGNKVKIAIDSGRIKVGTGGIKAASVTLKAHSGSAIVGDGTEGVIEANATETDTLAALTLEASGTIGNSADPTNALRVLMTGRVEVIPSGVGDGVVYLSGPTTDKPKYENAASTSARSVLYNGAGAELPQLSGALDAAYLDIRNQSREVRESGFAKENVSKLLRQGVVTDAGPGQPAIDDSRGTAGAVKCEGSAGSGAMTCL